MTQDDKEKQYSGKMVQIPVEVVQSACREGFFLRVQQLSTFCDTMSQAYLLAEMELERYGLPRRYADYESFRVKYWQWVRGRLG